MAWFLLCILVSILALSQFLVIRIRNRRERKMRKVLYGEKKTGEKGNVKGKKIV